MRLTSGILLLGILFTLPATADCSFRLQDGNLLRCGMATIDVRL